MAQLQRVLSQLRQASSQKNRQGMQRFGIRPRTKLLGTSMVDLRRLARAIGTDHKLALALWQTKIHEARILATIIADKEKTTPRLMDSWVRDFDSWDICDQTCLNLFYIQPEAYSRAKLWARDEREFVRRAGFALMAVLAFKEKTGRNQDFVAFFPLIKKYATDERNFVKKSVNWALRQIGKRNKGLNKKAIKLSLAIQKTDSASARWIANDALRELRSEAVQKRLNNK